MAPAAPLSDDIAKLLRYQLIAQVPITRAIAVIALPLSAADQLTRRLVSTRKINASAPALSASETAPATRRLSTLKRSRASPEIASTTPETALHRHRADDHGDQKNDDAKPEGVPRRRCFGAPFGRADPR